MLLIFCALATEKNADTGNNSRQRQIIALVPVQKVDLNALALNGAENAVAEAGSDDAGVTASTVQMQHSSPLITSGSTAMCWMKHGRILLGCALARIGTSSRQIDLNYPRLLNIA